MSKFMQVCLFFALFVFGADAKFFKKIKKGVSKAARKGFEVVKNNKGAILAVAEQAAALKGHDISGITGALSGAGGDEEMPEMSDGMPPAPDMQYNNMYGAMPQMAGSGVPAAPATQCTFNIDVKANNIAEVMNLLPQLKKLTRFGQRQSDSDSDDESESDDEIVNSDDESNDSDNVDEEDVEDDEEESDEDEENTSRLSKPISGGKKAFDIYSDNEELFNSGAKLLKKHSKKAGKSLKKFGKKSAGKIRKSSNRLADRIHGSSKKAAKKISKSGKKAAKSIKKNGKRASKSLKKHGKKLSKKARNYRR